MKESDRVSDVRGGLQAGIVWVQVLGQLSRHVYWELDPLGAVLCKRHMSPMSERGKTNKTHRFHLRVIILVS